MKKTYRNIILVLLLLTNITFVAGQKSDGPVMQIPKERAYLHLNASLFLSGENMLYSFYCMDLKEQKLSNISKIGYVELIDQGLNAIFRQKVGTEKSP